ncbi:type II secretion system F family protein [Actinomycetes bacterium KLBMP 9797]
MMTQSILAGGGLGLGLALVAYGLRPPRRPLAQVLDTLRRPPEPEPTGRLRAYHLIAAPARRLGLPRTQVRQDLATLQKDTAQHLAEQTAATLFGALIIPICATMLGFGGQIPLWLAVLGAALGFRWADANLHAQAERRRTELRHTLAVLLNLLTISLARGAGVEQALGEASSVCTGWAADRLRQVLATARVLRQPPWQALGELGDDTGVAELTELAAAMALAGTEGARVRASLAARAAAIRSAATAETETEAEKASSRMSVPLLILGLAYLIFLLYPPIVGITSSL